MPQQLEAFGGEALPSRRWDQQIHNFLAASEVRHSILFRGFHLQGGRPIYEFEIVKAWKRCTAGLYIEPPGKTWTLGESPHVQKALYTSAANNIKSGRDFDKSLG